MLRKLHIKYKIWRTKSRIENIVSDLIYYKYSLILENAKCFNKINIQEMFNEYAKDQIIKIRNLKEKLKLLDNQLEKINK